MNLQQTIPWITRADLQSVEHVSPTTTTYTVKDPVKDEFYFFSHVEFFFLKHLRTSQTFSSLIRIASEELGRRFGGAEIQKYLKHLARDNLIVPQKLGDGERLFQQRNFERRGQWSQRIFGLLSIKLSGFYPGAWLTTLKPVGWLCFNPVSLAVFAVILLATVLFALVSAPAVMGQVPAFSELISPGHLMAVLVGFCIAKILHELGHAIACQYTGHECSEMGVLLLVFMPCLYCDVSDVWTEKSRWKRMLVSLAGVLVELAIATICFWIWFFSVPGPLHTFCYSLMLITSVNTVFINGNPLMRYDGYYTLADWTGVPNLGSVSRNRLAEWFSRLFLNQEHIVRQDRGGAFLILYAILAAVYRWLILAAIGFGIWKFFDFQQLRSVGNSVVVLLLFVALVPMLFGISSWWKKIGQSGLHWGNTLAVFGLLIGIVYVVLSVEFSHRLRGTCQMQLAEPSYVFASNDGRFETSLVDGQEIEQGDRVGTIKNDELDLEALMLEGQLQETRMQLKLIGFKSDANVLAGKAEFWKQRESTLMRQLAQNQQKREKLKIYSPAAGRVVAFRYEAADDDESAHSLSGKSGTLLEAENQDCQISRGDPICYIGNPKRLRGLMAVDQLDIELVEIGQSVKLAIPFSSEPRWGEVVDISIEQNENDGKDRNVADGSKVDRTHPVTYRVEIEMDADPDIRVGSTQQAVIICRETNTLAFVTRWLRNSFWF